jgi:hypothetical protein
MNAAHVLSPHDERAVAVRAGCDPRTVRAYLTGRRQRSTLGARISAALREVRAWRELGTLEEQLLAAEQAHDEARVCELRAAIRAGIDRLDDLRRGAP